MKKILHLVALVAISLCFVQCETEKIGENGAYKGHEYVDLGLSVKWATCNVGATTPEEYGDYFAWGETETKEVYNYETYKYCEGTETTLTKYCHDKKYGANGFVDNKYELELKDDAAHVNWGGKWRMPTADELDDLRYSCTWEWTVQNGVAGLLGTSRIEGYTDRTIFFPAAGLIYGDYGCSGTEFLGHYWCKSVREDLEPIYSTMVFQFLFDEEKNEISQLEFNYIFPRFVGGTVRAVVE